MIMVLDEVPIGLPELLEFQGKPWYNYYSYKDKGYLING